MTASDSSTTPPVVPGGGAASGSANETAQCLVVSGFLGSGKTTLVRRLLERGQADGIRTAVVSNEFGELGIDEALLASAEGDFVELAGGCVCCRLSDDLLRTLQQLWERSRPERVVVETSGVALPYDTLLNFWRDPVRAWAIDASSVVVVSAVQVAERRDLDTTFEDQVCSADLLVLSKTDLLSADDADSVELRLREMQADVPILRASFGDVDPRVFFPPEPEARPSAGRADTRSATTRADTRSATTRAEARPFGSRGDAAPAPSHTHDLYEAGELRFARGVREDEVLRVVKEHGALRAKGFVLTDAGPRLVQGVSSHIELTPCPAPPEHLVGRVVVIERRRAPAQRIPSTGAER